MPGQGIGQTTMICRTWPLDKWLLITQTEHARIAGLIAASWSTPGQKPGREVVYAVAHHDDSWSEFDAKPHLSRNHEPLSFMEMDIANGAPIWSANAKALESEGHPYAARIVAAHFIHLANSNTDIAKLKPREVVALGKFLGDLKVLMERCRKKIEANPSIALGINDLETVFDGEPPPMPLANFDKDLRFLQVCDYLSLLLCTDFEGETVIENVPYLGDGDTLTVARKSNGSLAMTVAPLPFRKNLRDHLTGVTVPRKPYTTVEDLHAAYEANRPVANEFHIGAGA